MDQFDRANSGRQTTRVIGARIPNELYAELLLAQRSMSFERREDVSMNAVIEHLLVAALGSDVRR